MPDSDLKNDEKLCPRCKIVKNKSEFYKVKSKSSDCSCYCKKCIEKRRVEKSNKNKQIYIDYKGGKCSHCGYNKCIAALDFHHIDPNEKDFGISRCLCLSFDKIKFELDKCILLCVNCHRMEHHKLRLENNGNNNV